MDVEKYSKIIDGDEKFPDPRDHKIVSLAKKCRNLSGLKKLLTSAILICSGITEKKIIKTEYNKVK